MNPLNNLEQELIQASVQFFKSWFSEFISQNYLYLIILFFIFVFIWSIGLIIKNWLWKINKISDSLEKISLSLDYLATRVSEQESDISDDSVKSEKNVYKRNDSNLNI